MAPENQEAKVLKLETENVRIKTELAAANTVNKELKTYNSDLKKELEKSNANVTTAGNEFENLQTKFNELVKLSTEEITNLSEQLNSASKDADSSFPTLTRNRKKFKIIGKKFNYEGYDITVDQIRNDGDLADRLIKMGVGFLIEVTD